MMMFRARPLCTTCQAASRSCGFLETILDTSFWLRAMYACLLLRPNGSRMTLPMVSIHSKRRGTFFIFRFNAVFTDGFMSTAPNGGGSLSSSLKVKVSGAKERSSPSSLSRSIGANMRMEEAQEPPETELITSIFGSKPRRASARNKPKAADMLREPPPLTQRAVLIVPCWPGNWGCVRLTLATCALTMPRERKHAPEWSTQYPSEQKQRGGMPSLQDTLPR
mmetsp:Transcript_28040/g.80455  ORF Transcript_28040/g.80455 Transcript_28040/m.80455 type:complete len:222 (+) Transcript_28040:1133-1798(+)